MLIIFSRISSEKSGLFSESSFISPIRPRTSAFISSGSPSIRSDRYCTAATIGLLWCTCLRMRKRFCVEIKTFNPPSGRLIFFTIRATDPTSYKSLIVGFCVSVFTKHNPIKPLSLYALSTERTSSSSLIRSGVKIPG